MLLAELWKNSRPMLEDKLVKQIISFAGSGGLSDGAPSSREFREFLGHVPSDLLVRYANECLTASFDGSGSALQDIVNQMGRRLGFSVVDGRYKGVQGQIGYDGLWRFPNGHNVIVEVKTTDAYRIELDRISGYRRSLINQGEVDEDASSVLIVVGRKDTGELEAQIRGSRHAWDVRLISIEALTRLLRLKEQLEDPKTIERICAILIPHEFTRVDSIIDLVFSTTEEVKQEKAPPEPVEDVQIETDSNGETAIHFRAACIAQVEKTLGVTLVKRSASGYSSPDESVAVTCAVSKEYTRPNHVRYWFAFHTHQNTYLAAAKVGYLVLGCGGPDQILLIPYTDLRSLLDTFNITERNEGIYWHIHVLKLAQGLTLERKKECGRLLVSQYLLR